MDVPNPPRAAFRERLYCFWAQLFFINICIVLLIVEFHLKVGFQNAKNYSLDEFFHKSSWEIAVLAIFNIFYFYALPTQKFLATSIATKRTLQVLVMDGNILGRLVRISIVNYSYYMWFRELENITMFGCSFLCMGLISLVKVTDTKRQKTHFIIDDFAVFFFTPAIDKLHNNDEIGALVYGSVTLFGLIASVTTSIYDEEKTYNSFSEWFVEWFYQVFPFFKRNRLSVKYNARISRPFLYWFWSQCTFISLLLTLVIVSFHWRVGGDDITNYSAWEIAETCSFELIFGFTFWFKFAIVSFGVSVPLFLSTSYVTKCILRVLLLDTMLVCRLVRIGIINWLYYSYFKDSPNIPTFACSFLCMALISLVKLTDMKRKKTHSIIDDFAVFFYTPFIDQAVKGDWGRAWVCGSVTIFGLITSLSPNVYEDNDHEDDIKQEAMEHQA